MGNIVGPPLDTYVQNQIEIRQKALGNHPDVSNLSTRVLSNHNKGAWVRLASSVDLKGEKILKSFPDFNEQGSKLSKSFVLFGGIYNYSEGADINGGRKGGVVPSLQVRNNLLEASRYSYGLGSSEYALDNFPGLETVKIIHVNRGAIRKFQLKLIVNNKDQLEIIETLYLRLGYYLLLEWGNTNYFNGSRGKEEFQSDPVSPSTAFNKFFDEKDTALDVEKEINNSRVSSGGNYDGALFKVSNFSWSLNDDGSYSVSISGISKGGLIDSLIVNSSNNEEGDNKILKDYAILNPDEDQKTKILKKLKVGTYQVDINEVYNKTVAKLLSNGNFNKLESAGAIVPPDPSLSTLNISGALDKLSDDSSITIADQNKSVLNQILFEYTLALKNKNWEKVDGKKRFKKGKVRANYLQSINLTDLPEAVAIKFDNPSSQNNNAYEYNYITLGTLLSVIQNKILSLPNNTQVPISSGYEDNFMLSHWFQHSTDPSVCLIPFKYDKMQKSALVDQLSNTFRIEDNLFAGRLMSIHVNIEHIASVISSTKNNNGQSMLFPFLETLMGDIQVALGNMNNFLVTYDEDNGLNIKDDTIIPPPLPTIPPTPPDPVLLRLNGVLPNEQGSFVRKVSATSKITGAMATQIMIGSTASGGSDQINNSTALLSKWNSGLVDRIQKKENEEAREAREASDDQSPTASNDKLLESINKKYFKQLKWIQETYVDFKNLGVASNSTAQSNLQTLLEYDIAVKTINGEIAGIGFIPIDLSIEMDGMSGIKLYQKIPTTQEILPISYINKVEFIVTALDHTIQNNDWVTLISTLSVPKKEQRGIQLQKVIENRTKPGEFSLLNPPTEEE
mgnify:FL=1